MSSETLTGGTPLTNEEQNILINETSTSIPTTEEQPLTGGTPLSTSEIEQFSSTIEAPTTTLIDKETSNLTGGEEIKISNLEKLEYGWDKETMVLGNLFRIGKAKVQDLFDDDKTFKDFIIENEKKRIDAFEKEHWKFDNEAKDSGIVTTGSVLSMLLDPYYLAGYLNPVSLKAMTNPISAATLNGLLVGGDVVIDNLAKTGEIDWGNVAVSSGVAAAVGGVIPIGGKVLSKYAPKLIKSEVELVKNFIDGKLAKQNNLTVPQLKKNSKGCK